jgi:hypothetical protein
MDDSRRCTAKTRTGNRCKKAAMLGATVCGTHGGRASQVKAAAARNVEQAAAEKAVAKLGLPIESDPLEALLDELHRTVGHVVWLGQIVGDLDAVMESTMFGLAPSGWVKLYQIERTHLAKVARDCLASGVEERRVRLAEGQAELMAQAFRGFAVELGHDPADPAVRSAFRRHLAVVRGTAA